jgi:hypothetical protein
MISNLLMISPIDIGSSFWSGRTRITLICRTLLIECFGINFILLIPWRAPHLRVTFHHNSGDAAPSLTTGGRALTAASPTQDAVGALLGRTPQAIFQCRRAMEVPHVHPGLHPPPICAALLGGSKSTVTLRLPQAGHIKRPSSLPSGKFGPRVATSVSRSSCLR